jgi:hypothetical protein
MKMVDSISRSLKTAWPGAVSLAASLSQPRTDVEASDAAFVALLQESAIARWTGMAARAIAAAWSHSRARALFEQSAGEFGALDGEQTVRVVSWMVAVASALVLLFGAVRPTSLGPLVWILPALCGAASLVALVAAAPLARSLGSRRT